jgi:hypothetical protein
MIHAADPALAVAYDELTCRLPRPLADYERMLDELNAALGGVLEASEPVQVRARATE